MKRFFRSFGRMLVAGVLTLSLTGAGCTKALDEETQGLSKPVTLTMWGVIDEGDAYTEAINAYKQKYPNVTIDFRRLRLEEYEDALLNGLAEDRGPDLFLVHHDWTNKYLPKMSSMPASVRLAERIVQGSIKKEVTWVTNNVSLMTNREFRDAFVDTVSRDAIRTINVAKDTTTTEYRERIVGVPTFIDTLGLYYNRALLNVVGIPLPPETWDDFQAQTQRLTRRDARDPKVLLQSGAGIGLGINVERSTDLLTALMQQNGALMTDAQGMPAFHLIPATEPDAQEPPAFGALRFYTEFADSSKRVYTWNAEQPNSLEAFIQGKTAFFFGYAYQQDVIKARAPHINLGVTTLPHVTGRAPVSTANYWFWTVSKKTKQQAHAWNFLSMLASREQQQKISAVIKRPSPRRDVLSEQLRDENMGVFASQVLTASTWYTGRDPRMMEQALIDLIERVAKKEVPIEDAMRFTMERIGETY